MGYTALAHLRHFMATRDDYVRFAELFPLPTSLNLFGQDEHDRWLVVAHAMLLRKYFSGFDGDHSTGDNLALHKVIRSLRKCVTDPELSDDDWDSMEANVRLLEQMTIYNNNGKDIPEKQIMEDELYSRYLHGNPSAWNRRDPSPHAHDHATFSATHGRSTRMLNVAELIQQYVDDGDLTLDPVPTDVGHAEDTAPAKE